MILSGQARRQATGLIRTLVVAVATLAILLVCFAIYQSTQVRPAQETKPTEPILAAAPDEDGSDPDASQGVAVDKARIGPGRKVEMSFYGPEGSTAQFEVSLESWTPLPGSADEFLLAKPEVRMRTTAGNAIRLTAGEGILQGSNRSGRFSTQRGRFYDQVVIELDRLTQKEREDLPEERRNELRPADILRIEAEEVRFDLDYSKIFVPGPLRLTARDVEFNTTDIEVRFNENESRITFARCGGGRLVIRELAEEFGLSLPGAGEKGSQKLTFVDWLRSTIEARMKAGTQKKEPESIEDSAAPTTGVKFTEDGVPVFQIGGDQPKQPVQPVTYAARFQGNVDAKQRAGALIRSHLQADVLSVIRSFSDRDGTRLSPESQQPPPGQGEDAPPPPTAEMTINWTDRLVVETLAQVDPRIADTSRASIEATGAVVRITSPDGEGVCSRLTFNPDGAGVSLEGTDTQPALINSVEQGSMSGRKITWRREGDAIDIRVVGPGVLKRAEDRSLQVSDPTVGGDTVTDSQITFADHMEIRARMVTFPPRISFTGLVPSEKARIVESAKFVGDVQMRENKISMSADQMNMVFAPPVGGSTQRQAIRRVTGNGNVEMIQGHDRLTCNEVDMLLTTDRSNSVIPLTLTARGDVVAIQGTREIRASERLIADFQMTQRPPGPFNTAKAYAAALDAGLDITEIDWEQRRREHEQSRRTTPAVSRIRASGEVHVHDDQQRIDVTAQQLDCAIEYGREITTALIIGPQNKAASVVLDDFSVSGHQIKLHVPNQWAEVPGPGTMTFQSKKDLDGKELDTPIPITVAWNDWMKYRGRENRAVFSGLVHAASQTTTFDSNRFEVHFEDVTNDAADGGTAGDWWILEDMFDKLASRKSRKSNTFTGRFSKEPIYILATGKVVARTTDIDPASGKPKSRTRISGPKLSVNLKPDIAKMLIEGPGNLLLEDFADAAGASGGSSTAAQREPSDQSKVNLLGLGSAPGESKTLISWKQMMWYDFSIEQTRFEGDVQLRHLSGSEVARRFRAESGKPPADTPGRRASLDCDVMTVDFLERGTKTQKRRDKRMGKLSTDRLRQFRAFGSVRLHDRGLSLTASEVVYERDRAMLEIRGSAQRPAHIIIYEQGKYPREAWGEWFYYDLETKRVDARGVGARGQ